MKAYFRALGLCFAAATILTACSEPPEIAAKAAKRPDVAPYMGANNGFMTKGWAPGNQVSWTEAINKRNQGQNEYSRIK
ncbi:hypothetical protein A9236_03100 [Polynucleobacter sp. QLW-P1DATA-2]|uniref:hypothetical protein n=1 Tax=unclassified Polynucleobacter TaxID=2640945 RepID=UPI0008F84C73|nr:MULTISPECIES: hypothetical protein [unclassified Polynucleobacter]OIM98369.1 hypothetical protein A9235_05575 [Polynucleobacter sp. MWH-Tro8-2-5-gr]OIN00283.1 hypothetical protein A9236_03100 [Polynucleobacter sp. QLW-P1DATA-2]